MSDKLNRRLETAAYICTIVLAALSCAVLAKRFLFAPTPPAPGGQVAEGSRVELPGVKWADNERTLVMVLSTDCPFCTASGPFYQRLASEQERAATFTTVAVFPQPEAQARRYLDSLGVRVDTVMQRMPPQLGVTGTPTLILADGRGRVVRSWVGQLPPEIEAEVIASLRPAATASTASTSPPQARGVMRVGVRCATAVLTGLAAPP